MDCSFTTKAPTENDLMPKIAEHASKAHNIKTIDSAMMTKVKAAIKK